MRIGAWRAGGDSERPARTNARRYACDMRWSSLRPAGSTEELAGSGLKGRTSGSSWLKVAPLPSFSTADRDPLVLSVIDVGDRTDREGCQRPSQTGHRSGRALAYPAGANHLTVSVSPARMMRTKGIAAGRAEQPRHIAPQAGAMCLVTCLLSDQRLSSRQNRTETCPCNRQNLSDRPRGP